MTLTNQENIPGMEALVDITNLDNISFVKRAPLREILLWAQIFAMEGKVTKRLSVLGLNPNHATAELEILQYLYWNTAKTPPADDLETVIQQCKEVALTLPIDGTSVEELTARIPPDMLKNGKTNGGMNYMGQGSTVQGSLDKGGASTANPVDGADKAADKAALKAQKDAQKAAEKEAKAQKKAAEKAARDAAKAERASAPPVGPPNKETIAAAFNSVTREQAQDRLQAAFIAQGVNEKTGKRPSDPQSFSVDTFLKENAESEVLAFPLSVMWAAAAISGLKTAQFYRRDAIGLLQRLGYTVREGGDPMESLAEKEAKKVQEKAQKDAEKAAKAEADKQAKAQADAAAAAQPAQNAAAPGTAAG